MVSFNDPSFASQWQLCPGCGINATPLYSQYSGLGVRIGIVDTGLDYTNPDFAGRVDLVNDYDALDGDYDATNMGGDQHGTEIGLILGAAADNGYGRVGAAFGATLVAYRFDTRSQRTVEQETALLQLQYTVDVSQNSWSRSGEFFRDNFAKAEYAGAAAATAQAASIGRGGLGTVIVRSAGNDRAAGDDVNTHSYSNNRFTIMVGATDSQGKVQAFSNPGAALTVMAPATATSYAAPLASATAALMLQANPSLGYRDVAAILSMTAKMSDAASGWFINAGQGWNGGGLHASRYSGFGLIDALAAVRLAETWTARSTEASLLKAEASGTGAASIADLATVAQTVQIASTLQVERAEVDIDITHAKIGDLRIVLVSPGGTESVLLDGLKNGAYDRTDGKLTFTLSSTHFLRENAEGAWTLRVEDLASGNTGTLESWTLRLFGSAPSANSTHIYTNEFATLVAADPSRCTLSDGAGFDTLNAAAVTTASAINLTPGAAGQVAGCVLRIAAGTLVENAVSGDGADRITGNAVANQLNGMRGNDTINGGGGNDRLLGALGNDWLSGAVGNDVVDGGEGQDRLYGGAGRDALYGRAGKDAFVFDTKPSSINYDRLPDYRVVDDMLYLDNAAFKKLGKGTPTKPLKLKAEFFTIGTAAKEAGDYLIYNKKTGYLYYDADGSGVGKAALVAVLPKGLKMTYAEFFVI